MTPAGALGASSLQNLCCTLAALVPRSSRCSDVVTVAEDLLLAREFEKSKKIIPQQVQAASFPSSHTMAFRLEQALLFLLVFVWCLFPFSIQTSPFGLTVCSRFRLKVGPSSHFVLLTFVVVLVCSCRVLAFVCQPSLSFWFVRVVACSCWVPLLGRGTIVLLHVRVGFRF
jgi:hypothetical protein